MTTTMTLYLRSLSTDCIARMANVFPYPQAHLEVMPEGAGNYG